MNSLVEKINQLLNRSFPHGTVGDFEKLVNGSAVEYLRNNVLGYIGHSDLLGVTIYGRFTAEDGSALEVTKHFQDHAEVYKHLYKQEMDANVHLVIVERVSYE